MERFIFDEKIADISKSILNYCVARTQNRYDAEDLAQDIITELIKSVQNIRDDKAFYGFMWSVASKVYAMWCRKCARQTILELTDDVFAETDAFIDMNDESDLIILRRELTLLSEKYRKAVILYYFQNKSCSEISATLCISESMVKYLLFKARKILKEGMNMKRDYGEQSYNPKTLELMYMGEGPNKFWSLINGNKILQNILWACYNDNLTDEEISLEIGVALPYLETEIKTLVNVGLLLSKGNKYCTNIVIFTREFKNELSVKIELQQEIIADKLYDFIMTNEEQIRAIGFHQCGMSKNSFVWHITCVAELLLFDRVTENYPMEEGPRTAFGERAYVWGDESKRDVIGICNMTKQGGELDEGELHFFDYVPNPKSDHSYFYRNRKLANFLIKLAGNKVTNPNEYEQEFIADLISKGFVKNEDGNICVLLPVYSNTQIGILFSILSPIISELTTTATEILENTQKVLKNHIPTHLKPQIGGIAGMKMFDDVVSATIEIMRNKDYLKVNWSVYEIPTVFAVVGE